MTAVEKKTPIVPALRTVNRCGVHAREDLKPDRIGEHWQHQGRQCAHFVRHRERNNDNRPPQTTVSQSFKGVLRPQPGQQKAKPRGFR